VALYLVFVPTKKITRYQGAQIKSYPILDSLGWLLLYSLVWVCPLLLYTTNDSAWPITPTHTAHSFYITSLLRGLRPVRVLSSRPPKSVWIQPTPAFPFVQLRSPFSSVSSASWTNVSRVATQPTVFVHVFHP